MASMNGYPVCACKIIYHVKTQNVFVDEMRRSAYIQMIYSDMFSLDFDSLFSTVDLKSFSHFVIDTINNGNRTLCCTIQG